MHDEAFASIVNESLVTVGNDILLEAVDWYVDRSTFLSTEFYADEKSTVLIEDEACPLGDRQVRWKTNYLSSYCHLTLKNMLVQVQDWAHGGVLEYENVTALVRNMGAIRDSDMEGRQLTLRSQSISWDGQFTGEGNTLFYAEDKCVFGKHACS